MSMREWLGNVQRLVGKTQVGTNLAIRVRNQCAAMIGHHLADGPDQFENGEQWLARSIAQMGATFIDVGANVGQWATSFMTSRQTSGRGLLIEPSDVAFALLRQRFNGDSSIELVHAAAGDVVGESIFYEEPSAGQTSSLVPGVSQSTSQEKRIAITTIDTEIARHQLGEIDMMKIDVEGYDLHVLRGTKGALSEQAIGVVQFEYNNSWAPAGSTLAAAVQFLERFNYRIYLLRSNGLYKLDYSRYGEFFSYSNFVAISPRWFAKIECHLRGVI